MNDENAIKCLITTLYVDKSKIMDSLKRLSVFQL